MQTKTSQNTAISPNAKLIASAPELLEALRALEHAASFVAVQDYSSAEAVALRYAPRHARNVLAKLL